MDKILLYDDFLNKDELNKLLIIINTKWYYGHGSGNREKIKNLFFSTVDKSNFLIDYIKDKIEKTVSKKLKLIRHYMHIQTFGLDGGYHIDDEGPNKYTFCIYISDIDKDKLDTAGGEFLIKIPDEKFILSIEPILNRGIFFPSNYLHKGMAYNNFIDSYRLCLTWKMEEIIDK